jgi:hypothetical protein
MATPKARTANPVGAVIVRKAPQLQNAPEERRPMEILPQRQCEPVAVPLLDLKCQYRQIEPELWKRFARYAPISNSF